MKLASQICRNTLRGAVLFAIARSAFAADFIFSTGIYAPGTTAPEPLIAGQVLQINAGGTKFFSSSTMTNQSGLVNWNVDSLFLQNGAVINNQSVWDAKGDNALVNNGGPLSSFTNSGTFRKSGGAGTTAVSSIAFSSSGIIDTQTGTIDFSGANATFNAGSQFTGAGTTLISSNASFNGSLTSSNLVLGGGTITGTAAQINGSVIFSGGSLQGAWAVASGQTLNGTSGTNKFLSTATFTNNGTFNWQTTDTLFLQNGAAATNNALHDIQMSSSIINNSGPLSSYTNNSGATLRVAAGQPVTVGTIAFTNNGGTLTANGTLTFSGGNATFNAGSTFGGSAAIAVTNDASFNGNQLTGNLSLRGGHFTGSGAVIHGTVEFTGGFFEGDWDVAAGQSLFGRDGTNKFLDVTTLTNHGTFAWQTSDTLFLENSGTLDNHGLFDMQTGASILNNGGPLPTFTNSGTLQLAAGQTTTIDSVAFANNGGVIDVGAGGSLNFAGGNATFNAGTQFTGTGVVMATNNASFNGSFSSTNLSLRTGSFTGGSAVLHGNAEFTGGFVQSGWTVANGATLHIVDGNNKFLSTATLANQGTIAWQTTNILFLQNGTSFTNQGTLDMQTDTTMINNGGPGSTFINTGLITKTAGTGTSTIGNNLGFDNQGVINVSTGTIHLPDPFTNNGTLKGTGTFATSALTNAGHVAPGNSPGTLALNGAYAQTAAGFLDIQVAATALFDTLNINGTASLDGTLALRCVALCNLHNGDVLVILNSTGALSGTFPNVTTTNFGIGFQYDVSYDYLARQVKLTVIQAGVQPILDIDDNGTFDAPTDGLLVIRYLFGLTGTSMTDGAIGPNATRNDPASILDRLNAINAQLDIDGNGQTDALTDGLLVIRYLLGLRGASLIAGAVGQNATRSTATDIEAYIQTLMQ